MNKKIRILRTSVTNPCFNLATENWILRDLDPDTFTLYLWQNADTVVIGRYQNPWVECNIERMQRDNIFLARRQSGGGAVFQDLGNTNFTLLSSSKNYQQDANFEIIINSLASLGITAQRSGRNDILVAGRKISGSAFRHTATSSFHHGTLLVAADIGKLAHYLSPNKLKLQAKGIKSVQSRVANLVEFAPALNNETLCAAIIDSFCAYHGCHVAVEWLDEETLQKIDNLKRYYNEFADWDWRFGKTPQFSHHLETRFDWGIIDLHLDVKEARIWQCKVFSDALDINLIAILENELLNMPYHNGAVNELFDKIKNCHPEQIAPLNDVANWLNAEIKDC